MSLTDVEGPSDGRWPAIDFETQSRLLLFFRPKCVYTHRPAQEFGGSAKRICEQFKLGVSPAKLVELAKVWKYNALESPLAGEGQMVPSLDVAVGFSNHSCSPNCCVRRLAGRHSELIVGQHGVSAGEELTINYVSGFDEKFVHPTKVRRQLLAMNWLFFCTCSKCTLMEVPHCPDCIGHKMQVLVSRVEALACPVICTRCDRRDLHCSSGYFFCCSLCGLKLCGWPDDDGLTDACLSEASSCQHSAADAENSTASEDQRGCGKRKREFPE